MSASIRPLIRALDQAQAQAQAPVAPATLEEGLSLADRVMRSAEEEGRRMTRDEALFLAGQQLAQVSPTVPRAVPTKRVWTNQELEALYPPGVSENLRLFAPLGFGGMLIALMAGMEQVLTLMGAASSLSSLEGLARLGGLALTGLLFWASRRLCLSVSEPNKVFRSRLEAVDTDSLVRWYYSGCVSRMVVFGVLHDRGIRVR